MRLIDADAYIQYVNDRLKNAVAVTGANSNEGLILAIAICKAIESDLEDEAITPTIDAEPRWIPVSERFPQYNEENGFPYVLVSDGIGTYIGYYVYDYVNQDEQQNGKWYEFNHDSMSGIIAWMPLPEPYERIEE